MKYYNITQDYVEAHFTNHDIMPLYSLLPAAGLKQGLILQENLVLISHIHCCCCEAALPTLPIWKQDLLQMLASAQTHSGALKVMGAWLTDSCGDPWHQAVLMGVEHVEE